MVAIRPDLQAFLAKDVYTGTKFASTPMEEPPKMDPIKMKRPSIFHHQGFIAVVASMSSSDLEIADDVRMSESDG